MIAKQALIEAAGRAAQNQARPLSAQCARAIGSQLERSDPAWWKAAEAAWKDRYFPSPDHALLLVLAALHHEGICGRPLAAVLPTCGGDPAGLLKAVAAFLEAPSPEFTAALSRRFVNYSSLWASRWLEPAQLFFQRRNMPYAVVELNSVGGLGACADLITPKEGFDSSLIRSRTAVSEAPLDLRRDADAQWLLACSPLDVAGISDAAGSARRLREALTQDTGLASVVPTAAADLVSSLRPAVSSTTGAGLLVFSLGWLSELTPARRVASTASVMELFSAFADRALWIEVDRVERAYPAVEVRAYRMRDGQAARQALSTAELTAGSLKSYMNADPAAFLA